MTDDTVFWVDIPTRWHDNDIYGHVNNVQYYAYFDTAINTYLVREGGLDIHHGDVIGVCAESHCTFRASFTFPETVRVRVVVDELRTRAVRYAITLHGEAGDERAAGWFVHVFVDRVTRRPVAIPGTMRQALARLRSTGRR